jgi:hypothetical protein
MQNGRLCDVSTVSCHSGPEKWILFILLYCIFRNVNINIAFRKMFTVSTSNYLHVGELFLEKLIVSQLLKEILHTLWNQKVR